MTAQFTTASLSGTVADQSGASVPGAKVTVQNADTGFTQATFTGSTGDYLFARLPIGKYKLAVEKSGFTNYIQSGIQLSVSQTATQAVTLSIGGVSQDVSVTGDASLVTTQSASISQVVNERQIVDLPLDGRQVQSLVFLSAGIADATSHYCGSNCEGGTYPGEQYAKANGTFSESINYQMDGVAYNDTYVNTNLPFPNPVPSRSSASREPT
jgi:Carboxypeptidase regulatory-like domain